MVLEIKASGMCGSDLKFYRSAPGEAQRAMGLKADAVSIAGHEPCGMVVAVGDNVNQSRPGLASAPWCTTTADAVLAHTAARAGNSCA